MPETRCPRDSGWCTGDNCAAIGRPDCPNADHPWPDERGVEAGSLSEYRAAMDAGGSDD